MQRILQTFVLKRILDIMEAREVVYAATGVFRNAYYLEKK